MHFEFKEHLYGFCVIQQNKDGTVTTWFGTGKDASERWADIDFHPERLGRKRGFDPLGTFVYDSIHSYIVNNLHYPKTVAFRRDFAEGITVIVTEAHKEGDRPWEACCQYWDLPPQEHASPSMVTVSTLRHQAQRDLVRQIEAFIHTGGSATEYTACIDALLAFQQSCNDYREMKATNMLALQRAKAQADLEAAQKRLAELG